MPDENITLVWGKGSTFNSIHLDEILKKFGAIEITASSKWEKRVWKVNGLTVKEYDKRILVQGKIDTRSYYIIQEINKLDELSLDVRNNSIYSGILTKFLMLSRYEPRNFKSILGEYKKLVDAYGEEPEYQKFFTSNPQLLSLDIEYSYPKFELGADLRPDFLLILFNKTHILVEIENPKKQIFTKEGSESKDDRGAIKQLRDFHTWVCENLDFLRNPSRKIPLPNINSFNVRGLLLIGHSQDLDEKDKQRLSKINAEFRGLYEIKTFDELYNERLQNMKNFVSVGDTP